MSSVFGRQCAIQAVSGAAVVQEEETSTGAESKIMRVDMVEAGQENMLFSTDSRRREKLVTKKTMTEAVLCINESRLGW